jgi:hypothetical protein
MTKRMIISSLAAVADSKGALSTVKFVTVRVVHTLAI